MITCLAVVGGCGTNVQLHSDEIRASQRENFDAAVIPVRIDGLILLPSYSSISEDQESVPDSADSQGTAWREIVFGSLGGRLDSRRKTVTGITADSTLVEVSFDDIRYIKVKPADVAPRYTSPKEMEMSRDEARERPQQRIKRAASIYWDVIDFDEKGGTYDPTVDAIVGSTKRGTPFELAIDRVQYVQFKTYYRSYDMYRNVRIGIALAGLATFYFGAQDVFDL
jgi:hypothetical protein